MATLIVALAVILIVFVVGCWWDCHYGLAPHDDDADNGPWGQWMRID